MTIKETQGTIKIDANINVAKKSIVKFQCSFCGRTYKAKSAYNRHHKRGCKKKPTDVDVPPPKEVDDEDEEEVLDVSTNDGIVEEEEEEEEEEEKSKDELREEVLVLYRNDPASLLTECDNEIIKVVNKMSRQDLKLKIAQKRLLIGAKLNGTMTNTMLLTANKIVGGIMKCQQGLNQTTMNDEILKESCDDLLSYYLLDSIPVSVRLGLLYGSHVISNTFEAKQKRDSEIVFIPRNMPVLQPTAKPELKEEEEKKEESNISMFINPDEGREEEYDEPPTIINN